MRSVLERNGVCMCVDLDSIVVLKVSYYIHLWQWVNNTYQAYLAEAAFAQHLYELEVFHSVLPEARYGPGRRGESTSLPEDAIRRGLLCNTMAL